MNLRRYVRLILLFVAFVMLVYQSCTAFSLLMNPPMVMITSETNLSDVRQPLMYLCPSIQYDDNKVSHHGYQHTYNLVFGHLNANDSYGGTWGAHLNMTWEQLIRNVVVKSPEEFVNNTVFGFGVEIKTVIFPKYGFCYEANYTLMDDMLMLPGKVPFKQEITFLLTDQLTKSYYRVDSTSQSGSVIYLDQDSADSYIVDIEMHVLKDTENCNSNSNYSYEKCVDDYITKDLKTKLGCIPPLLSDHDHCGIVAKEKQDLVWNEYRRRYAQQYMVNIPTKAEKMCPKPCKQQKIKVTLKDQGPLINGTGSFVSFAFNPKVKVLTEQANYSWFNFIVDIGSSLGTWAGLSAISLIDIALHPISNFKTLIA